MADPKKVKPAKASGGPLTEDDLDKAELLNGMGVTISAGEIQRLIEAARANVTSVPPSAPITASAAPTQRIVVPRRQRQRAQPSQAPLDYTPLPPMPLTRRIQKPRVHAPAPPPSPEKALMMWGLGAVVLLVAMPVIIMISGAVLQAVSGRPTTAYAYTAIMGIVLGVFVFTGFFVTIRQRAAGGTPPTSHPGRDDEDDGYITQTYRDQRWQGDNGLNGRVGWEANSRHS